MLATIAFSLTLFAASTQPAERIVDIQIQGNTITGDEEILRLAGVQPGMAIEARTTDQIEERLRSTDRFETVEVLKRYASISDATQITLVIVVGEGRVAIRRGQNPVDGQPTAEVVKRRGLPLMFVPILDYEDGYGFTYGARVAWPGALGSGSRLSFPATWGAQKRAGAELERDVHNRLFSRIRMGGDVLGRKNPHYTAKDDRVRVWARAERELSRSVRVGATVEGQRVSFSGEVDRFARTGVDVTIDTRIDPMLARNAVYARAAVDRFAFGSAADATRVELDARGYLSLPAQGVLVLRGLRQDSNRPLPPYLKPLLGGTDNVRGFRAGTAAGDTLLSASGELRWPLSSPISYVKFGISAFVDTAAAYDKGERGRDQVFTQGWGGGVWLAAAVVRLNLSVAHGKRGSTRALFGTTIAF